MSLKPLLALRARFKHPSAHSTCSPRPHRSRARVTLAPAAIKHCSSAKHQQYDRRPAVVTHQLHAPGLAFEFAQAAADFDAKEDRSCSTARPIPRWRSYCVELRQLVSLGSRVRQSHGQQARFECDDSADGGPNARPNPLQVSQPFATCVEIIEPVPCGSSFPPNTWGAG